MDDYDPIIMTLLNNSPVLCFRFTMKSLLTYGRTQVTEYSSVTIKTRDSVKLHLRQTDKRACPFAC